MTEFLSLYRHSSTDVMGVLPGGKNVLWGTFYDDVQAITAHVNSAHIVLTCSDTYNFTVAFVALTHLGTNIILPPNLQSQTQQDIANAEDAEILDDFTIERFLKKPHMKTPPQPTAQQSVITLYTSGSSGMPTAIKRPLAALEAEVRILHKRWEEAVRDGVFATSVAHYHAYGLPFYVLWAVHAGAPMILQQIGYPEELIYYAEYHYINFIASPTFFKRHRGFFNPKKAKNISYLNFVTSAGSPLPPDLAQNLADILPAPVVEIYGSTETGAIATRNNGDESWECLDGVTIDRDENEHIYVSSPAIGHEGGETLHDRIEVLENGHFLLNGRNDRIIKVFEKRISLDQFEAKCCEHEWIEVMGMVTLRSSERLGAVAVLTEIGKIELERLGRQKFIKVLRAHLLEIFVPVSLPRKWRFVDELPINDMGKVNNVSLLAIFDAK